MLLFGSCVWVRPVCRRNTACFGCSAVRLFGCSAVRRNWRNRRGGCAADRRLRRCPGCSPAVLCGAGAEPAFRVRFLGPLSEPAFRTRFPGLLRACFGSASGPVLGSASGPVSGSAFGSAQELFPGLLSGLASGAVARIQVLFCLIAECGVWFRSGRRIRLCDFCRSRFRRRARNSLLPVFHGLRREPVI